MNAYFDIRNGHIAIVETDTPEPGWIKLTSKQSRLAARYRLDDDGKVVDAYPGKTDEEVLSILAEQAAKAVEAAAEPAKPTQRPITKLAFMERFTDDELAAIYAAAKTDVRVEVWMDKLKLAEFIDLADTRTQDGVTNLEAAGLIAEGRAAEILAF